MQEVGTDSQPRRGPALAAAETVALQASIVESAVDAIVSLTFDGIVTSWNRGAEMMYGYTAEQIIGQVAHPKAREQLRESGRRLGLRL